MNVVFSLVAYALRPALPAEYAVVDLTCRVFTLALTQNHCGACAAFAVATRFSMRTCLRGGPKDAVLSPYRLFDCTRNASCESGATIYQALRALDRVSPNSDVRDSPHSYGHGCVTAGARRARARPFLPYDTPLCIGLGGDPWRIRVALWLYGPLIAEMEGHVERAHGARVYHRWPAHVPRVLPHGWHAVVLLGWDAAGNWLVQNSWGEQWGDAHGRGWIAPDVLMDAIDPTMERTLQACAGLLIFTVSMGLCLWLRDEVRATFAPRPPPHQSPMSRGLSTIQHSSVLAVSDSPIKTSSTPSSSSSSSLMPWVALYCMSRASISACSSAPRLAEDDGALA
jgi:hypothetical protein